MSTSIDLSDDLAAVVDGLEAIIVRRAETTVAARVDHALRRPVSERESAASGGTILLADAHFHLPIAELPIAPRVDDELIDAGGAVWVVLQVQSATQASRWDCLCRYVPPDPL